MNKYRILQKIYSATDSEYDLYVNGIYILKDSSSEYVMSKLEDLVYAFTGKKLDISTIEHETLDRR